MGLAVATCRPPMGQGDQRRLEAYGLQYPREIFNGAVQLGQLDLVVHQAESPHRGSTHQHWCLGVPRSESVQQVDVAAADRCGAPPAQSPTSAHGNEECQRHQPRPGLAGLGLHDPCAADDRDPPAHLWLTSTLRLSVWPLVVLPRTHTLGLPAPEAR